MSDLSREDLLREEALVRAREVCLHAGVNDADGVVAYAEAFYKFLADE
jgi:hypothetical protein